jgi:phosphoribosylaminoimidazole-succinocarboxamide synthase
VSIRLPHRYSGKVRELYDAGDDQYLMVATDRLSVFDVVLDDPIPDKGRILTGLSAFWFARTASVVANHVVSFDPADFPPEAGAEAAGRAVLVRAAQPVRLECVARGYLFGSAWPDYEETGTVQGRRLPAGLREAEQLPTPIFTPTTKADAGHDLPLTDAEAAELIGVDLFEQLRDLTLRVYTEGAEHARSQGLILADTKLEFGTVDDELLLIDEVLTPDSSRYWAVDEYGVGSSPPSFDKQFARDYYASLDWDRTPPAPPLPAGIVAGTRSRYVDAYERITGAALTDWYGASGAGSQR